MGVGIDQPGQDHGIAALSIDDGRETLVDCYSDQKRDRVLLYASPELADRRHTLRVRVTGEKSTCAKGTRVTADSVLVTRSSPGGGAG